MDKLEFFCPSLYASLEYAYLIFYNNMEKL
jgi:hypothetical protein